MANFPSLRPATVSITPGVVPATPQVGYDGSSTTSTADLVASGDSLTLTLEGLTEAQAKSVPDHQLSQRGKSFGFDPVTLATALTPAGFQWTYARPVEQDDIQAVAGSEFYRLVCEFVGVWIRRASTPSATARIELKTTAARALPAGTPSASATLQLTTTAAGMVTGTPSQSARLLLRTTPANVISTPPATALVLYSNNFDTAPVVAAGVSATLTPGLIQPSVALSPWWTGNYYANQTTSPSVLSLTGNVPAGVVKISFTLGFLGSWDSSDGEAQPDYLQILINNSPVLTQLTTNNGSGTIQNYGGGTVVSRTARTQNYISEFDTLVDMSTASSLSFNHAGGSLSFAIQGYGGGYQPTITWSENPTIWDEGWGIDNLVITVS